MGFFGKMWQLIKGFFIQAGDNMVSSSPEAIRSTYASAIDDAKRQYKDMQEAVALLARERERTEQSLRKLEAEETELRNKLDGALAMAAKEPDNPAHREAGTRYLGRIKEIDERQAELTDELEAQRRKVEHYKEKLRKFTEEIDRLKKEQGEMVAEFVSTQQVLKLEDRLQGLSETAVDESIVAIREKVGRMKEQAKIATEMRESSSVSLDEQYERMGSQRQTETEFDQLLQARVTADSQAAEKERDLG
jgi:phage shock protein A